MNKTEMQDNSTETENNGFNINAEDMGGAGHRNIILDLWSGDVWVRQVKKQSADTLD